MKKLIQIIRNPKDIRYGTVMLILSFMLTLVIYGFIKCVL